MGATGWEGKKLGILSIVGGTAFLTAARTVADPDLWGHLLFGQEILALGRIPRADPYSYLSADYPWINHEWLTEVTFAFAYGLGGPAGLTTLKILVVAVIVATSYRLLVEKGFDVLRGGMLVVPLLGWMYVGIATVRPHLFTFLFFFLTLLVLHAAERGRSRWLWALPPIFALWVNFHGGVLAGLGIAGAWAATRGGMAIWRRYAGSERSPDEGPAPVTAFAAVVGAALATLVNPYGIELLVFLVRTATVPRPEITEWQRLEVASPLGLVYLSLLAVVLVGLYLSSRPKRPGEMAVLAICAVVPLLAVRHIPLFALAAIVMGGDQLAGAFARRREDRAGSAHPPLDRAVTVVGVLGGFVLVIVGLARYDCIRVLPERYPIDAVEALRETGATGNLAIEFNWGEYAIWHLQPDLRVSMDGRRETVYSEEIYDEYMDFAYGREGWDALLDKRPTDAALVPRGRPVFNLLALKAGWSLVYSDELSGIFARDGWAYAERLRAWTPTTRDEDEVICFPVS